MSENLKETGMAVFDSSRITGELIIPDSVKTVGDRAFSLWVVLIDWLAYQ